MARKASASRARVEASAPVFAALGDETRLALVLRLAHGGALSIARLTDGTQITRQAVTKHLRVRGAREGRESLFALEPRRLAEARQGLDAIAAEWDRALERLRALVER